MKNIEKEITAGLVVLDNHPGTVKFGRNRKTFYEYPRIDINELEESIIEDRILLEINTFTHPSPVEINNISTFIHDFLINNGFENYVREYGLEHFEVLTLSIERTFCEKLLSLIRLSYEGTHKLKTKIRHFYDIAKIMKMIELSDKTAKTFQMAFDDDKSNSTFSGLWIEIIGFRNILAHGYDVIDDEIVWDTIKNYIPQLLTQINTKLQ